MAVPTLLPRKPQRGQLATKLWFTWRQGLALAQSRLHQNAVASSSDDLRHSAEWSSQVRRSFAARSRGATVPFACTERLLIAEDARQQAADSSETEHGHRKTHACCMAMLSCICAQPRNAAHIHSHMRACRRQARLHTRMHAGGYTLTQTQAMNICNHRRAPIHVDQNESTTGGGVGARNSMADGHEHSGDDDDHDRNDGHMGYERHHRRHTDGLGRFQEGHAGGGHRSGRMVLVWQISAQHDDA